MSAPTPIDLLHCTVPRVIGVYLLRTDNGWALVDCGPSSTVHTLEHELRVRGLSVGDLRHLLLTHIHLDHAGAAGVLVRRNPELRVHVSPVGAPHLVEPERLERSARRLYGEVFDELWGELAPVPAENIDELGDEVIGLDCFPAPGHASHQVCFLAADGTLYPGDAAGVRIMPGTHVVPYAPPPDIDVEAWHESIDEIERRSPARLALPHFGVADDVERHLEELRQRIDLWTERVGTGMTMDDFVAAGWADVAADGEGDVDYYTFATPFAPSFVGIERYWSKRREAV